MQSADAKTYCATLWSLSTTKICHTYLKFWYAEANFYHAIDGPYINWALVHALSL